MPSRCPAPRARVLLLVLTVILLPATAAAQGGPVGPPGRVDLGLHVAWMRQNRLDTTPAGLGGRVTVELSNWFGIEGDVTFYPQDDFTISNAAGFVPEYAITTRRSRLSGFFGPRAGARSDRLGVFGFARPGFTRLKAGDVDCEGPGCAIILLVRPEYRTEFAFDVGGTVELYFPSGATIRVDAADTVIRHRSLAPPCLRCTTHNFTLRTGIGVRF
jgi:hypothetical protein